MGDSSYAFAPSWMVRFARSFHHTPRDVPQRLPRYDTTQAELRDIGLTDMQLKRREIRYVKRFLESGEHIKSAISGRMIGEGSVLLVATDVRVIHLHVTPHYSIFEEFPYNFVTGISIKEESDFFVSLMLFTKYRGYEVDFITRHAAEKFTKCIETKAFGKPGKALKDERGMSMG